MSESPHGAVLVTGATGNVGQPLVTALRAAGDHAIEAHQTPTGGHAASTTTRTLDFYLPDTFIPALAGVDRVFLMRPPPISDTKRYIRPFVEAMANAGVRHVVLLSLMGVNRVMPHWRIEQDLRASGIAWTFLRPAFFSQNLGGAYRDDIRFHDRIRLASGRGRTSFIDTRDIADVAARVLADTTAHAGAAYTLTGPEAIDYHTVASMLSAALGRTIRYVPIGLLRYRRELLTTGLPTDYVNVQLLINTIAKLGRAARIDPTLPRLLDRPPRTLQNYINDNVQLWAPTA